MWILLVQKKAFQASILAEYCSQKQNKAALGIIWWTLSARKKNMFEKKGISHFYLCFAKHLSLWTQMYVLS